MHRNDRNELQRLEHALLAQEHEDAHEDFCDIDRAMPPKSYKAYNADRTDEDPEVYSQALLHPQKGNRGLILLAIFLSLCIAGVALYWLMRFRGIL